MFGEGIGNAEFVLTQENVEANADCNSFGHTQKTRIQSLSDQLSNGLDYDQVWVIFGLNSEILRVVEDSYNCSDVYG